MAPYLPFNNWERIGVRHLSSLEMIENLKK